MTIDEARKFFSRVDKRILRHFGDTGRWPAVLYLGTKELAEFTGAAEAIKASDVRDDRTMASRIADGKYRGADIVPVVIESHLNTGAKP
jgi:hypothetical protein